MADKSEILERIIWQLRRAFQQLASASNEITLDLDINASQRAVLEFLSKQEPLTVPNIARRYDVSRQHIQQVVNELLKKQLLETIANPEHKRSVLVQMTDLGRKRFAQIRRREVQVIQLMSQQYKIQDLQTTLTSLQQMGEFFQSKTWQKTKSSLRQQGEKL